MQKMTITVLGMLLPAVSMAAPEQPPAVSLTALPLDVQTTIVRTSICRHPSENTLTGVETSARKPLLDAKCDTLNADEIALREKYRLNATVIQALDGKLWVKFVQRLQIKPDAAVAPSGQQD